MRKLALIFLVVSAFAFSSYAELDRDVLLTENGTLYTVQSQAASTFARFDADAAKVLTLTIQNGLEQSTVFVPGSLTDGIHSDPSLAYDGESDTLFIFWQRMPNAMSSELLFCSYHEGVWSDAASIDDAALHIRYNLRIGTTRFVNQITDTGLARKSSLIVHAIWWDESGYGESARYAMISIERNSVKSIQVRDLLDFVGGNGEPTPFDPGAGFDRDFLRHPAIFEAPTGDSVEVIFANWDTNRFEKVRITPVDSGKELEGVLHIPVGVWRGEITPPRAVRDDNSSKISALASPGGNNLIFYWREDGAIRYVAFINGQWKPMQSIALNDIVSQELGVDALRKLASTE